MMKSFKTTSNIIKFDDDTESQQQQSQKIIKTNQDKNIGSQQNKYMIKQKNRNYQQNPQLNKYRLHQNSTSHSNSQMSNFQLTSSRQSLTDRTKYQSLRRNKSFKVKKQSQEELKNRRKINKSVTKFTNIFQQAQQVDLRNSNRLAVHNQSDCQQNYQKNKIKQQQQKISSDQILRKKLLQREQYNTNKSQLLKSIQKPPILKLSNFKSKNSLQQSSTKKSVKFMLQSTNSSTLMSKTLYSERQNPMKQLLDRKLSYRPEQKRLNKQPQNQTRKKESKQINNKQKTRFDCQDIKDVKIFTHTKISKNQVLIAKLKKNTDGFNFIWPQFHMVDQKTDIHLLSAKKKAANTTSNYYISTSSKQIDIQNQNYMGKVRSNFLGSCFNIFNQGSNPEAVNKKENSVRQLLATVIYQSQIANANPKTMRIYMIKQPYSYYDLEGTNPKQEETNLEDLYQIGQNKSKLYLFKNRRPTYNKKQNKFVLNFEGRVKRPSTKNFIIEDSETKRQVLMFGKTNDEQYIIHISSPITPHIGLGIALAELDSKIICD